MTCDGPAAAGPSSLGHDRAPALDGNPKKVTRSQIVMLITMVCFTCPGLWLLSAANG